MTVQTLDLYCREIQKADRRKLKELRAILEDYRANMQPTIFHGLNQDIRDRADWLRDRRNK